MDISLETLMILGALFGMGMALVMRSKKRSAVDVAIDLEDDEDSLYINEGSEERSKAIKSKLKLDDELGLAGLLDQDERERFALWQKLYPIIFAFLFVLGRASYAPMSLAATLISCGTGLSFGIIVAQAIYRHKKTKYIRDIEYYLPIIMERVVMAVQAGLDILAALQVVLELEESKEKAKVASIDPVSKLLSIVYQLSEAGLSFDQALHDVAAMVECSALRHAFIHLAMAHSEGGELVMPLRELSDSTQLYLQETIEEEIAKMPVKATMPLLLTFAGLLVCFIVPPLMQVLSIAKEAASSL